MKNLYFLALFSLCFCMQKQSMNDDSDVKRVVGIDALKTIVAKTGSSSEVTIGATATATKRFARDYPQDIPTPQEVSSVAKIDPKMALNKLKTTMASIVLNDKNKYAGFLEGNPPVLKGILFDEIGNGIELYPYSKELSTGLPHFEMDAINLEKTGQFKLIISGNSTPEIRRDFRFFTESNPRYTVLNERAVLFYPKDLPEVMARLSLIRERHVKNK